MRKFLKMLLAILMLVTGIISVSISASADELTSTPLFGDISLTLSNGTYTGKVTAYNDVAEDIGDIYIAIYNSEDGELEQVSSTPIISSGGTQTFTCTLSPKVTGTYTAKMFVWNNEQKPFCNVIMPTFEIPKPTLEASAVSAAPLAIPVSGYAVTATKKSYNVYNIEIVTADAVVDHEAAVGIMGKWVGFRVIAPTDASYAEGTFGGTDYGSVYIANDGFIDFYVDANNPKDVATLTFYDSSGNALTAEMIFNIDVSGVVK